VGLGGRFADAEVGGDLGVGQALGNQLEDVELALD
jgi:hypothetical protein